MTISMDSSQYQKTIHSLQNQLFKKDQIIFQKNQKIASKEHTITLQNDQIARLNTVINDLRSTAQQSLRMQATSPHYQNYSTPNYSTPNYSSQNYRYSPDYHQERGGFMDDITSSVGTGIGLGAGAAIGSGAVEMVGDAIGSIFSGDDSDE